MAGVANITVECNGQTLDRVYDIVKRNHGKNIVTRGPVPLSQVQSEVDRPSEREALIGQRRRLAAVHLSGRVCVVLRRLHVAALDVSVVRQDVVLYDGVLGPSLPAIGSRNTTVRQRK